jgi:predicted RNA binding protein YcfA (HicA-like mRNA interferase family)
MALSKRTLVRWLLAHGFTEVPRHASSHRRFRQTRTTVTVADHGRAELSSKHVGMLLRELERAGFDREQVRRELGL